MKTLDEFIEAIKDTNFVWKHNLTYFFYESISTTSASNLKKGYLVASGNIPDDEIFRIPKRISGIFDIVITGPGYYNINCYNHPVNIANNQTELDIPNMLIEINDPPF